MSNRTLAILGVLILIFLGWMCGPETSAHGFADAARWLADFFKSLKD